MSESIARASVAENMRSVFIHAEAGDNLLQVAQVMQVARIRHLPVLRDGVLVGILSHRDVLEYSASPLDGTLAERLEPLRSIPVTRVMHTGVHGIAPDATLAEAAREMLRYKIGCLPVVLAESAGDRMVGLLTESDLLAAAYLPRVDARTLEPCIAGAVR